MSLVLALSAPAICHAQADQMDSQDPSRYSDEDSQLLNLMSYPLRPVGWVLEWTVTRPLHYLTTSSPMAPVLGANIDKEDTEESSRVRELPPPDAISASGDQPMDTEITPAAGRAQASSAQAIAGQPAGTQAVPAVRAQPAGSQTTGAQPALEH
ncbi:MAG TPA: hypothetical protein VEJ86_00960 [Candidatus Binataceae bacterium]|nr:hypothetical protein [Candidatus Binataceae bacterium]